MPVRNFTKIAGGIGIFLLCVGFPSVARAAPELTDEERLSLLLRRLEQQDATLDVVYAKALENDLSLRRTSRDLGLSTPGQPNNAPAPRALASQVPSPASQANAAAVPLFFQVGDSRITPTAFIDFTSLIRAPSQTSGLSPSPATIPLQKPGFGQLSEFRGTAWLSRIGARLDSRVGPTTLMGRIEVDFAGSGNEYTVSSYQPGARLRLAWLQATNGKVSVLGGQSWSLLTPGRRGLSPLPETLFYNSFNDLNYTVGFASSRNAQIRLTYRFSGETAVALSAEEGSQWFGTAVAKPAGLFPTGQVDFGIGDRVLGRPPDIIAKIAHDSELGRYSLHLETGGIYRRFRLGLPSTLPVHPKPGVCCGANATGPIGITRANGIGAFANVNLGLTHAVTFFANNIVGQGIGRYLSGLGPDFIIRPDESISPVRAAATYEGLEISPRPSIRIYGYYGAAYFAKNLVYSPSLGYIGFGVDSGASLANRVIQEATLGYSRTIWSNPYYGALVAGGEASYVWRSPWGSAAHADANVMFAYINLRYIIP